MTYDEWETEGVSLFGKNKNDWKFICPVCWHVASVKDYIDAGATPGMIGFSCIGRLLPGSRDALTGKDPGPCNYTGGGLFCLNPKVVDGQRFFDFAQ